MNLRFLALLTIALAAAHGLVVTGADVVRPPAGDYGTDGWETVMTEGFEGVWPSTGWSVGGNPTWDDESYRPRTGSWSGYCVGSSVNPPGPYPINVNATATYGPFSLSGCTDAELNFYHWTKTESGYDSLIWYSSVNGTSWTRHGARTGNIGSWQYVSQDLSSRAGQSQVWIRFQFKSDASVGDEGVYLDDIILRRYRETTPPTQLTDDVAVSNSTTPKRYYYNQTQPYWHAVGIRSSSDWDVALYNSDFTDLLASSEGTEAVDFCLGDGNHQTGTYGVEVYRYAGTASSVVEYEDNTETFEYGQTNGPYSWTAGDVVECYDIYLESGEGGTWTLDITSGSADLGFAIYKSNGGPYFCGKYDWEAHSDGSGGGGDESFSYTAPASDWYGVVVWANDGNSCSYTVRPGNVPPPPQTLDEDVAVTTSADQRYRYQQNSIYWNVVGVRSPSGSDWDIATYDQNFQNPPRAASGGTDFVDFCVSDCNHAAQDIMGVQVYRYSGTGSATVEYEGGADALTQIWPSRNGPYSWPAGDVVEAYDVFMDHYRGRYFTGAIRVDITAGTPDLGIAVFKSPPNYQGRYECTDQVDSYGPGGDELLEFDPDRWPLPWSDWMGIVVWNNNANGGTYYIDVVEDFVAVEEPVSEVAVRNGLRSVSPNPTKGTTHVTYTLREQGKVRLVVCDAAGRVVRQLASGVQGSGVHVASWDGRDERGAAVAEGVYLVRLDVAEGSYTERIVRAR